MTNQNSPANNTSADLEKAAIEKLRSLILCIPQDCKVYREIAGSSPVLCLDFVNCPHLLDETRQQSFLILLGANYLALANSLILRVDRKVIGWTTLAPTSRSEDS
jgi:hypothetical protein